MSTHLSAREFVDSVEGVLAADRRAHLESCDACRRDVDDLRRVLSDVERTSEVPEPSPLFWQHFSERVRHATSEEPVPVPRGWWAGAWRPLVAAAAGAVVLALVFTSRSTPDVALPTVPVTESAGVIDDAPADDGTWDLLAGIASTSGLAWEDVQQVARPRPGTADALISTLTPAERAELARMLRAEIGEVE